MTPKEKADELVKKMYKIMSDSVSDITLYFSKQCALIAVDEIINNNNKIPGLLTQHTMSNTWFWQEVKQEIERL